MSDRPDRATPLDADRAAASDADSLTQALEAVIDAARAHLAALRAADGARDDEQVWRQFVTLGRATAAYDRLLYQRYGETTPWDPQVTDAPPGTVTPPEPVSAQDPYPSVVSVRHRRDYRVPSVSALLAAARHARRGDRWRRGSSEPTTVGEALLELVASGDGSLGGLEVPELEPLGGTVAVVEQVTSPPAPSQQPVGERLLAHLEEQPEPPAGRSRPGDPPPTADPADR
jgi:hypothetical protein